MPVIWRENKQKTITVDQQGRFWVFHKRNSPYEYRYDMSNGEFYCWRKAAQERYNQDSRGKSSWFMAKLVTEDHKFEVMFKKALEIRPRGSITQLMALFQDERVKNVEGWAALGITVDNNHRTGWGNFEYGTRLEIQPRDLSAPIREFITTVNDHWNPAQINSIGEMYKSFADQEDKDIVNEIFGESIVRNNAGIFTTYHDGHRKDHLYDRATVQTLVNLIKEYKLPVMRFMWYINMISTVECIDFDQFMQIYPMYLTQEYEDRNRKRSKMYKFPVNLWTEYMRQETRRTRERELDHYNPDAEELAERAILEYENDEYCIRVPRGPEDIREEARVLDHCAATAYLNNVANGRTAIVFMRRKANPNRPFVTIEVRNNRVRQCQGDRDHRRVNDHEKAFIREWAAVKGINVDNNSWTYNLAY